MDINEKIEKYLVNEKKPTAADVKEAISKAVAHKFREDKMKIYLYTGNARDVSEVIAGWIDKLGYDVNGSSISRRGEGFVELFITRRDEVEAVMKVASKIGINKDIVPEVYDQWEEGKQEEIKHKKPKRKK